MFVPFVTLSSVINFHHPAGLTTIGAHSVGLGIGIRGQYLWILTDVIVIYSLVMTAVS